MSRLQRVHCTCGSLILYLFLGGCANHQPKPSITAHGLSPANQCEPEGIPYYLPKPLLVVAKNFRHIDESKVGLSSPAPIPEGFDNQAAYADVKANVTVPNSGTPTAAVQGEGAQGATILAPVDRAKSYVSPSLTPGTGSVDGSVAPDSFFTYQIIFVPDLTQKYGLKITGGAGEFRAAMNMVNGWMYTGMGPFYLKDSSSAQNVMAQGVGAMFAGRGAADVLNEVGDLTTAISGLPGNESATADDVDELTRAINSVANAVAGSKRVPEEMINYAEIYIYEPFLVDGEHTEWRLVAEHSFNRHYFASETQPMSAEQQALLNNVIDAYGARKAAEEPVGRGATKPETNARNEAGDALVGELDGPVAPQPPQEAIPPVSIEIDNSHDLPAPREDEGAWWQPWHRPLARVHSARGNSHFRLRP